jgi:hypothetical protein
MSTLTGCYQGLLERLLANPAVPSHVATVDRCSCCSFCSNDLLYPKEVNRQGVCKILFKIFVNSNHAIVGPRFYPTVVEAIKTFPSSSQLLFNSKARLCAPKQIKQVLGTPTSNCCWYYTDGYRPRHHLGA